ncbi:MAG TPA: hypothetical protein VFY29_12340 [Terriglobia bacterium]|nr:hypothetical protein [Terriglobia bacterium]
MRTFVAFFIALFFASVLLAQSDGLDGKWLAQYGPPSNAPLRSDVRCSEIHPGHVNAFDLPPLPEEPAELDLKVDSEKGTVTGSLSLPPVAGIDACMHRIVTGCGKLKIVDGKTNGETFQFTTYTRIYGFQVPTQWTASIRGDGAISLVTSGVLPCDVDTRLIQRSGSAAPPPPLGGAMLYQRADGPGGGGSRKEPRGAAGKWWTTQDGQLTLLEIKTGKDGKVTGSVTPCRASLSIRPEHTIEGGAVSGDHITFESRGLGQRAQWNGVLVNDDTLRLQAFPPMVKTCQFPNGLRIVFNRSAGKNRTYLA